MTLNLIGCLWPTALMALTSANLQSQPALISATNFRAVPTFESFGLYCDYTGDDNTNALCRVEFRETGAVEWRAGLELFADRIAPNDHQFRGSLVHLRPGTSYEVRLTFVDPDGAPPPLTLEATTWSETFPIGQTIVVTNRTTTLIADQSGRPDGYTLYTAAPGTMAEIHLNHAEGIGVLVRGNYIILRGLKISGPTNHCILIEQGRDLVVEQCEMTDWGSWSDDNGDGTLEPWGVPHDAVVYSRFNGLERLVFQRNRVHHPHADSNNWEEPRELDRLQEPSHPHGPQPIYLFGSQGNHVFRYNTFWTDIDHMFNDIIGGAPNASFTGFPFRDSDIYGNYLQGCWDNAIEADGANQNVRIWGNFMTDINNPISINPVSVGPLYIWRNITGRSRHHDLSDNSDEYGRGRFIKIGGKPGSNADFAHGAVYVFHNTILQPAPEPGRMVSLGCSTGLGEGNLGMTFVTSRNNIFHMPNSSAESIRNGTRHPSNSFDYDLFNGTITTSPGQETHGIRGVPIYASEPGVDLLTGRGSFSLASGSPGLDAGALLPNFNDGYAGAGPDIGAHESGEAMMQFGSDAFQIEEQPSLTINSTTVIEGNSASQTINLTLTLSFASSQSVTVDYTTADETALAAEDYVASSGQVQFAAGETTRTIALEIKGDTVVEPNETFLVRLSNAVNATLAAAEARVTIENDDALPAPELVLSAQTISEGNSGSQTINLTLTLSFASSQTVTVDYTTADETAMAAEDYVASSGQVQFAAGETTRTIALEIKGDTVVEPNETFLVKLSKAVNATLAAAEARVTIENDDALPVPELVLSAQTVSEGNSGSQAINLTLTLSFASSQSVTVDYTTADETAVAAEDYVASSGQVQFAPGETTRTIALEIKGDTVVEPNETFLVRLSNAVRATLATAEVRITILNDDLPQIFWSDLAVSESANEAVLELNLSAASSQTVTLNYATESLTAEAELDFKATAGVVTFLPGTSQQFIRIVVFTDALEEPEEKFLVKFSSPQNATIANSEAAILIQNVPVATNSALFLAMDAPIPVEMAYAQFAADLDAALKTIKSAVPDCNFVFLGFNQADSGTNDWKTLLDVCHTNGFRAGVVFFDAAAGHVFRPEKVGGVWQWGSLETFVKSRDCVAHPALYCLETVDEPWHGSKRPFYTTPMLQEMYQDLKQRAVADFKLMLQFSRELWKNVIDDPDPATVWEAGLCDFVRISALEFQGPEYQFALLDSNHYWARRVIHEKTPDMPLWTSVQVFGARYGPFPQTSSTGYWFPRERSGEHDLLRLMTDLVHPKYEMEHRLTGFAFQQWDSVGIALRNSQFTLNDTYIADAAPDQKSASIEAINAVNRWVRKLDEDQDRLPDFWELLHGLDPASASDGALDSDGDGAGNLMEFQAGTHPRDQSSVLRLDQINSMAGEISVEFTAVAGKSYTLQVTPSLSEPAWTIKRSVSAAPTNRIVQISEPLDGLSQTYFYRIAAE
ncbi:MAG: Calx-beta domain-containing protein [Verrucomicrobiota bacterium]